MAASGGWGNPVADVLGKVGLPAPVADLAGQRWDVTSSAAGTTA